MAPDAARLSKCLTHVRTLNRQFKAWIDREWEERPDCLWSNGVKDYLDYSSVILKEFSDVVAWMAEEEKCQPPTVPGKPSAPKATNNGAPLAPLEAAPKAPLQWKPKTSPAEASRTPTVVSQAAAAPATLSQTRGDAFSTAHGAAYLKASGPTSSERAVISGPSPGLIAFGVPSGIPGDGAAVQLAAGARESGEGGREEGEEGEEPGSPSVRRAEEEGVEVVLEERAKLWIQEAGQWKARGSGAVVLKLMDAPASSSAAAAADASPSESPEKAAGEGGRGKKKVVVFRNDAGKVLLSAGLPRLSTSVVQRQNSLTTALFCSVPQTSLQAGATDGSPAKAVCTTVLFRFATADVAAQFKASMEKEV